MQKSWSQLTKLFEFAENFVLPTWKITVLGAIFVVNSSVGKLWDLLGHFDEKDTVDFDEYHFLLHNSIMLYVHMAFV